MLDTIVLNKIEAIARDAGDEIMKIYERDFQVDYKDDKSPLTEADTRSNEIICNRLEKEYPEIPILSEEGKNIPYEERREWGYFWLIDPIDGTKEFIKKNGEFTVNIALVHQGIPVLGVVYAPALGDLYKSKKGEGAFKNGQILPLERNEEPEKLLRIVASKSHLSEETQDFIDELAKDTKEIEQVSKGSSLKLVMVAEGSADIYPRLAPTMEWDTAAADAIVREAGKMTYQYDPEPRTPNPEPLLYNKENLLNPWFVVR
ncbi:MAG TPA: 3'(2'),5'-bisphosphate nucleotidase [Epsilonproteobacteria bacterium]|nr:3'(2'),5'-bisphosphate nucleotidase [Campylobacterota bacterium]